MNYTLEQKRDAVKRGDLWWRFPEMADEHHQRWTLVHEDLEHYVEDEDLQHKDGIYHIGPTSPTEPTPPRVLSELEGELLEALKWMRQHVVELCLTHNHPIPQASLDRSTAAIQKAEAQQ